jgi:hypothetical protein
MFKFSCLIFGNPTNKTETVYMGTSNNKARRPIIVIDQSRMSRSHVQFITLFLGGAQLSCAC